jgi:hypothetical protein
MSAQCVYRFNRTLTEIVIDETIVIIPDYCFQGCVNLRAVTLPTGLRHIGVSAFEHCAKLRSIVIPLGVHNIFSSTFEGCTSLATVTIMYPGCGLGYRAFYGSGLTEFVVPPWIGKVEPECFAHCDRLCRVTLPPHITEIAFSTFYNCCSLAEVHVPDGVTHITRSAFSRCSSLTKIMIPKRVTYIGVSAFYECIHLRVVEFMHLDVAPHNDIIIRNDAFHGCDALALAIGSINKPDGLFTSSTQHIDVVKASPRVRSMEQSLRWWSPATHPYHSRSTRQRVRTTLLAASRTPSKKQNLPALPPLIWRDIFKHAIDPLW